MTPRNNFTGQGFKGERALAITAVLLTIVSTVMLIDLTIMQRRHTRMEMDKLKDNENKK